MPGHSCNGLRKNLSKCVQRRDWKCGTNTSALNAITRRDSPSQSGAHFLKYKIPITNRAKQSFSYFSTLKEMKKEKSRRNNESRKVFNVGQGFNSKSSLIKAQGLNPAQKKMAITQLDSMEQVTKNLLALDMGSKELKEQLEKNLESLVNDARVVLHFWSTKWPMHFHPFCAIYFSHVKGLRCPHDLENTNDEKNYGDYGPKQAERVLNWIMQIDKCSEGKYDFANRVFGKDASLIFAYMIDSYLLPCTNPSLHKLELDSSGHDIMQYSSASGTLNINVETWAPALCDAFRIIDVMEGLKIDKEHLLRPTTESKNAIIYTWMKWAVLLDNASTSNPKLKLLDEYFGAGIETNGKMSNIRSPYKVVSAMEEKLSQMENAYFETKDENLRPNTLSYNHVLRVLYIQNPGSKLSTSDRIRCYLDRMEQTEDVDLNRKTFDTTKDSSLRPTAAYADVISYNIAINAISSKIDFKSNNSQEQYERALEADTLLTRVEERYQTTKREDAQPDTITYSNVIKAWANAGKPRCAEAILNRMITLSENSERDVKPNLISFNTVIDAWAKSKEPNAAENALNILQQMENISESLNDTSVYPDTISYSSVISAMARSEKRNAGLQAVELLERSLELYSNGMETLKPDSISFCTTLDALSKQSQFDEECIRVAQQIFRRMKQMGEDSDSSVQPTTIAYNIMLKIFASSGEIEELKLLFEEMLHSYKKGDIHVAPDDITYNTYLSALSNAKEGVYVKEALRMLKEWEEDEHVNLSVNAYVHILGALAKQTRHGENFLKEMEKLLDSLEERFLDGKSEIIPNTACYNCYIDALSKCASLKEKNTRAMEVLTRMKNFSKQCPSSLTLPLPDAITYTSIINTISYSKNDNIKLAEDLISQMKAEGLKPNRYTYNSLIKCISSSKRKDAAKKAEDVLLLMSELGETDETMQPDKLTFAAVINCWAHTKSEDAGNKAREILQLMEKRSASGDTYLTPTIITYGTVLNAYAKCGHKDAPKNVLEILSFLEKEYEKGNLHLKPNGAIFNVVLNTIAKSKSPSKAKDAENILDRMFKSYENGNQEAKPNIRTFSTVLNACAYTNGDKAARIEAFQVSRKVLKEILGGGYGSPNEIVFSTFLKCCSLIPGGHQRDELAASIFHECCSRGLVDVKVILNLRRALSSERLNQVLDGTKLAYGHLEMASIPKQWKEKVNKNFYK